LYTISCRQKSHAQTAGKKQKNKKTKIRPLNASVLKEKPVTRSVSKKRPHAGCEKLGIEARLLAGI
jgi:hypothetical protein